MILTPTDTKKPSFGLCKSPLSDWFKKSSKSCIVYTCIIIVIIYLYIFYWLLRKRCCLFQIIQKTKLAPFSVKVLLHFTTILTATLNLFVFYVLNAFACRQTVIQGVIQDVWRERMFDIEFELGCGISRECTFDVTPALPEVVLSKLTQSVACLMLIMDLCRRQESTKWAQQWDCWRFR